MASITVLPELEAYKRGPGAAFGEGLSQALEDMFAKKQRQKQYEALSPVFKEMGLSDDEIRSLSTSNLDVKDAMPVLKMLQEQKEISRYNSALNSLNGGGAQQFSPSQEIRNRVPSNLSSWAEGLQPEGSQTQRTPMMDEESLDESSMGNEVQQPVQRQGITPLQLEPDQFERWIASQRLTPRQRAEMRKEYMERNKFELEKDKFSFQKESADKKLRFKETEKYREQILSGGRQADEELKTLDLMDRLVDTKKLSNPIIAQLADKYGATGLLSPESQIFQKALGTFLPSMSETYGARVTNQHEKIYLSTLPRLIQTDPGKKQVIKMLRVQNEAKKIKSDALRQVLKANKGIPPLDIDEQVEKIAAKKLDENYKKFLSIAQESPSSGKSFKSMPQAKQYVGKKIRDTKTGKVYISDGSSWVEEKE